MSRPVDVTLDEANPNALPSAAQQTKMGKAFRLNSAHIAEGAVAANVLALPENARAAGLLSVYSRVGGVTGYFGFAERESTPGAGNAAVDPEGNVEFAAADAVTEAEVVYMPAEGDVIEEQITVPASGIGAFLQGREGVILLTAELLTGAAPGVKTIDTRGAAPGAGEAALSDVGQPIFLAADVGAGGGTATVRYIARPGVGTGVDDDLLARLAADSDAL